MSITNDSKIITSGIGKRKEAVALVKLCEIEENNEAFNLINGISPELYLQFNSKSINTIFLPLEILNLKNKFNVDIKVRGGGLIGQTDAIKLGLSRALCKLNDGPENRTLLKSYGLLTRDARIKESKKYGLKKARKASQYSKR
jgi:small subunit ribosomal protein S9